MTVSKLAVNERPDDVALRELWNAAWGSAGPTDWERVLSRSLCYVCAYQDVQLIGFVNVAWDGGSHASIFDTCVHPRFRRQGVATALVQRAAEEAAFRGAEWLHVDFEAHLVEFYRRCGFRPTAAGLMALPPRLT